MHPVLMRGIDPGAKSGFWLKSGFAPGLFLSICLLLAALAAGPAAAQGCDDCREIKHALYKQDANPPLAAGPTSTVPIVRIVLFWAEGCGHCHEVIEGVLPALQRQHGAQLEIRLVEVISLEDISAFFDVAEGYGYARGKAAVPFLLVGDRALMGVAQIERELPGFVSDLLVAGGADWPALAAAATGAITVLADDTCGFALPCAEGSTAAQSAKPAAAQMDHTGLPGVTIAGLGLIMAAGIGLTGLLRVRAQKKERIR